MERVLSLTCSIALFCSCSTQPEQRDYLQYVNTMIGTGAHYSAENAEYLGGVTRKQKPVRTSKKGDMGGYDQAHDPAQLIPAVLMPHGMTFWTPQTADTEQKGIAPYYYADDEIQGFRGSHWIVGGMTQDYGSMTIMPQFGSLTGDPLDRGSKFSHQNEVSTPAYYSVELERYGIQAEMTATSRTALFRFTFDHDGIGYITVNANSDEAMGSLQCDAANGIITGSNPAHRIYQGLGQYTGFDGHFVVEVLNKEIADYGTYNPEGIYAGRDTITGTMSTGGAYLQFDVKAGETVYVRAATSFTSIEKAKLNLLTECPDCDFDKMRSSLEATWQQTLSAIEVESDDPELLTNFYTSLYHASFLPREFNDVDGSYPSYAGNDSTAHTSGTYYDDYSMWDTYRALHPLKCLIDPERAGDMIQSLLDKYDQGGWLPIFPCWNSYTSEMIGDHCASLIADAYFKGVRNFDINKAYEALYKNAFTLPETFEEYAEGKGRRALDSYLRYGYIPVQDPVADAYHKAEQTSRTLEYAYDDFVFARFAQALGHDDVAKQLFDRSQNYRNVINPATGWADGRNDDGSFHNSDPWSFQKFICEGQPCHYTWYVPHDIAGLMELMGGEEIFVTKLDSLFETGHYWHGNEPSHQICYLYDYTSQPEKTQKHVRETMKTQYAASHDGLAGNDDAGQMSAWYIFSALGFYPVCPGTPEYAIGSPVFNKAVIHLPSGRDFTIIADNASAENIFIKQVTLNGKPLDRMFISHDDIANGGTLHCVMGK